MNCLILLLLLLTSGVTLAQHDPRPKLAQVKADYGLALARHDTLAMAESAYLMGKRYQASGDYVSARRWLLYTLRIRELRGPSVELNKVYVQLASSSTYVENYSESFAYAYRALANSRKLNHPHSLMSAYNELGKLHWLLVKQRPALSDQPPTASADSAVWYLQQAESIALRLNNSKDIAATRFVKGSILAQREPRKAIPLLMYALGIYEKHRMYHNCAALHVELANAHIVLNQMPAARQHLLNAQHYQRQGQVDAYVPVSIQYSWARWHQATGHWQQAYKHLRIADSLRHIVLTTEQRAIIAQLNVAYETSRRETILKTQKVKLALRDSQLQVQRQYTYALSGLLALVAITGFLFYRLNRQNKRISLQNAQLVQEQSHRMKNNLQTISGLLNLQSNQLADGDAKRAMEESQLRVYTMTLLNRKLYDKDQFVTPGLPTVIPDLVQAIMHSYGYDAIQPDYELKPVPLHIDQAVPIALIINELVTNACKYAFPNHPNPALRIRCWREKDTLRIQVQDNGPGTHITTESTGFGLRLIAIQVQQLRGEYKFSGPPGVTFDLSAPINSKFLNIP